MLARSVRNPLVIGLGTGVVLIGGSAPAALATDTTTATPTPTDTSSSPSPSATTTPPPEPTLSVTISPGPKPAHPGSSYSMDVSVNASGGTAKDATLTVSSARAKVVCDSSGKRTYTFRRLGSRRLVAITVSIPTSVTNGTVTVSAHLDAANVTTPAKQAKDAHSSFTVTKPKATPSPKPSATPSASHSSGSGSGTGSGSGSSGSSGSNSTPAPMGTLNSTTGKSGSSTGTPPQTASLPDLTQQTPTTAPGPAGAIQQTSNSQSMRGTGDGTDQLTFGKLASTQAAWLAALLVAFSLLLTQVRLGKATTKDARPKGTHRKPRRRVRAH